MKPMLIGVLAALATYGMDQLFWSGQHVDPIVRMLQEMAHGFGWA